MFDSILAKYFQYEEGEAIINLLISAKYTFSHSKDEEMLEKILVLSGIDLSAPLFLKHLDNLDNEETDISDDKYFFNLKRSPHKLQKYPITWLYYSLFWALQIEKDSEERKTEEYPYKILQIVLYYHYYYLRYRDEESKKYTKEEDIQGESFFKSIAQSLTRAIEYLTKFSLHGSNYFDGLYLDKTVDDWGMNFLAIVSENNIEKNYYFIMNDDENYLLYENKSEDIKIQVEVSRKINSGKKSKNKIDESIVRNTKISGYFDKGFTQYKKMVGLVWKKSSGQSNKGTRKKYNRQYTEVEPLLSKTHCDIRRVDGVEIPTYEEEVETALKENIKYRVSPEGGKNTKIQNAYNQRAQNRAFSASVTKRLLLLPSYYNVPTREHLADLLKFIYTKPMRDSFHRHDFYLLVFIMSILIGRNYEQIVELFYEEDRDFALDTEEQIIKIKIDETVFADNVAINEEVLEKSVKTISYTLPKAFILLIKNMSYKIHQNTSITRDMLIQEESRNKYKKYIRYRINLFDKKIPLNLSAMWRISDTYKKEELKEDMSSLFCIGKYQTNDRARLAYASTHKNGQIHSLFIEKLYLNLGMHEITHTLNNDLPNIYTPQIKSDSQKYYVGSSRAVRANVSRRFFKQLKRYINEEEDREQFFNLVSIYTKFALSMLLGTRSFIESTSLKNISFSMHVLTISEKATTQLSGIRVIPLCDRVEDIIKTYQHYCKEMDVLSDNIYLIDKGKVSIYNEGNARSLISQITKDVDLIKWINNIPINTGRHVISKLAMETNFNGYYLETFLGHYNAGAEQFGVFSSLNTQDYIFTCRELTQKVALLYGVQSL